MFSRTRKIHHTLVGHLPYSRARGRRAHSRGRGEAWLKRSARAASFLDGLAGVLLLAAAALALAAVALSNGWLAAGGGLALSLALFTMAATLWVDQQVRSVEDHAYYASKAQTEDPPRPDQAPKKR